MAGPRLAGPRLELAAEKDGSTEDGDGSSHLLLVAEASCIGVASAPEDARYSIETPMDLVVIPFRAASYTRVRTRDHS